MLDQLSSLLRDVHKLLRTFFTRVLAVFVSLSVHFLSVVELCSSLFHFSTHFDPFAKQSFFLLFELCFLRFRCTGEMFILFFYYSRVNLDPCKVRDYVWYNRERGGEEEREKKG